MGTFDNYQEFNPANSLGRRTLMKTTSSTWTTETAAAWSYDQRGRVVSESRMIAGSGTFLTQWGYNSGDMLSWIKYPGDNLGGSGEQVNYTYLPQGALLQVTNATKYALNMQYDAAGRLTSITRGVDILNTAYAYYPWDIQGGRLKTIKTGTSIPVTPTLQSFEYDYDPNGNVDWIKDYLAAGGTQTQTFHYDELNRLKDAQASGGTNGTYAQQGYNYDSSTGNLNSKAGAGYTYNAQVSCAAGSRTIPHAASVMGSNEYSYDCNGNMDYRDIDGDGAYTLVYDAENRLVSVSGAASATFVYDGDGKRVKATVNGTETAYVGNYYEWSNNSWTKYYYAGTTRVAMRTSSALYYLLGDHLGSTSIVATHTGVKYSESRYMPWGEDRYTSATPPPTAYLYTGQKLESGLGLYFYNSRWYDSQLGRFTSPDSIVPEATQGTQAWDRYAYANNNSVRHTDPSGHCIDGVSTALCIAVGVGAIIGAAAGAVGYIAATKLSGDEIDPLSLAVSAGSGLVSGGLAPIIAVTAPTSLVVPATLTMYGAVTAGQYAVDQTLHDQPVDATSVVANFAVGSATGIVAGTYAPFDELGREGMSKGLKIGMSFSGHTAFQGEREAAKEFVNYQAINGGINFVRTFASNLLQTAINKLGDWFTK